ncbi:hypothetical protein VNPA120661_31610 [Pseudomonas aeruginosa]|nr:hypothetical protein RVB2_27060 [Pseudomonas aeruginosa]GLE65009.1 hypothetical protein VNPA110516_51960 [Pseudomonas aeruginosa]GLE78401.1 hypothetical protein VNPA120641_52730 [Pseudomonas aeruginosa]GLE82846.1 hypothetical protein VNPA120661_31610 [Pseudomonas aeruginosa]GLE91450.1 hypothetical protein VNPA120719_48460 [Pseudomonas aeruginosa]
MAAPGWAGRHGTVEWGGLAQAFVAALRMRTATGSRSMRHPSRPPCRQTKQDARYLAAFGGA